MKLQKICKLHLLNIDEIIQSALATELKPIEWSKEDIEAHDQSIAGSKEKARPTIAH